jgi:hypothetical protein
MLLRISLLSLLTSAAACSSLMIDPLEQLRDGNKQNLAKVAPGMTRMEVESVMGHARAGGKLPEVLFGRVQYLEAKNPMREEKNGDELVLYYYTDVKNLDDRITDDELTPVVLRDGKVIGVGAQFVKR